MESKVKSRVVTRHFPGLINADVASSIYELLKKNVQWEEGIKSRKGFTRLAKSIDPSQVDDLVTSVVMELIETACTEAKMVGTFAIHGVYINYYRDGDMWTPNHTHPKTCQMIISLGATRTLQVGKKNFKIKNGDAMIFGSAIHGVPKEPEVKEGRISIATFMRQL